MSMPSIEVSIRLGLAAPLRAACSAYLRYLLKCQVFVGLYTNALRNSGMGFKAFKFSTLHGCCAPSINQLALRDKRVYSHLEKRIFVIT